MIAYRDALPADGPALDAMAAASFTETFGAFLKPADLADYLAAAHGDAGSLRRDLADPTVRFRLACDGDAIVGYAKLTGLRLPVPAAEAGARELGQFYVLKPWQGRGVADALMAWALTTARATVAPALYLGVFEDNARALAFYRRHGFAVVGEATFRVGTQVDRDLVMRRAL